MRCGIGKHRHTFANSLSPVLSETETRAFLESVATRSYVSNRPINNVNHHMRQNCKGYLCWRSCWCSFSKLPCNILVVRHLEHTRHLYIITGKAPYLEASLCTVGVVAGPPEESLQLGSRNALGDRYEGYRDAE